MRFHATPASAAIWLAALGCLAGGLWLQLQLGLTPDVSWLLTVAERVLGGEKLYTDIVEFNPPFSVWMYMPPAVLSAATGLSSEFWLYALFCLLLASSFASTSGILVQAGSLKPDDLAPLAILWVAVFTAAPLQTFLQREHIAVLCLMPWIALQVRRFEVREAPTRSLLLICGVSCAVVVLTKPYYALTILAPVTILAFRVRSIRPFFHAENLLGAAVCLVYAAAVFAFYPAYVGATFETLKTIYLPVRTPEATVVLFGCALALIVGLALWRNTARRSSIAIILVAAAIGHLAGVFMMGHTFTYHVLPAYILLLLAGAAITLQHEPNPARLTLLRRVVASILAACALYVVAMTYLSGESSNDELVTYLRENHAGETFLSVSPSLADGHPLVRDAGGLFVGTHSAMVVQAYGSILKKQRPDLSADQRNAIDAEIAAERKSAGQAILERRPEVILISRRSGEAGIHTWDDLRTESDEQTAVSELYRLERQIGDIGIYTRLSAYTALP